MDADSGRLKIYFNEIQSGLAEEEKKTEGNLFGEKDFCGVFKLNCSKQTNKTISSASRGVSTGCIVLISLASPFDSLNLLSVCWVAC